MTCKRFVSLAIQHLVSTLKVALDGQKTPHLYFYTAQCADQQILRTRVHTTNVIRVVILFVQIRGQNKNEKQ